MYESLQLPWSSNPSPAERVYRDAGLVKTKGTVYVLPPPISTLRTTFHVPPRPKARMSSGANALCKHFERGGASSERGIAHPFWTLPTGSNDNKSAIAASILQKMLETAVWRNVMMLHTGVAIYELRNSKGYGMRWTLQLGREDLENAKVAPLNSDGDINDDHPEREGWCIKAVAFRGFVEPIEEITIPEVEVE